MKKWIPILILALAQFVMVLDGTVMNVSISTVAHDLGTTITGMQTAISDTVIAALKNLVISILPHPKLD